MNTDNTKTMIDAVTRIMDTMHMQYEGCQCERAWENKCPHFDEFVVACTDFIKLDPPHPDHEFVKTVRSFVDDDEHYFSDSTYDDFSGCDDSYINKLEYPRIPTNQPSIINIHDLTVPESTSWVYRPSMNVDFRDAVIYERNSGPDNDPKQWLILGFEIDDDGDLRLLVIPKED